MLTQAEFGSDHRALVIEVDRAICELRRGGAVVLDQDDGRWLVRGVESLSESDVQFLYNISGSIPTLFLSTPRGVALGVPANGYDCVALQPRQLAPAEAYRTLGVRAEPGLLPPWAFLPAPAPAAARALMGLAKCAQLMPALVGVRLTAGDATQPDGPRVRAAAVARYWVSLAATLQPVAEARVPLSASEESRFVLFRAADGRTEHVAVVVGDPDVTGPVMVRMHSACFTGDLFSSLKCDCGDQLRTAVGRMARIGGGVLLYLNQEGRGIGLANKLRAYGLQGQGYDTLDADATLGFEADERRFEVAAVMLRALGVGQARLMTNNPAKVLALEAAGIEVTSRIPVLGSANPHNERYLRTKVARAGHLFDPGAVPVRWNLATVAAAPLDPAESA